MGLRRETVQKRAVKKVFSETLQPLKAVEAFERAQAYAPRLGMATLYRIIRELLQEGSIINVELPGETTRYEQTGKAHHHHFRCRTCQGVYEVGEGCPGELNRAVPKGFKVESHDVVFYGLCGGCNSGSSQQ